MFAHQEGYRTLCVAYKQLNAEEYAVADSGLKAARLALQDREEKLMAMYNQVETGMSLIGATAVEDRLVTQNCSKSTLKFIALHCFVKKCSIILPGYKRKQPRPWRPCKVLG